MLGLAGSVQISDLVVWKGGCFLQLSQLEQPSLSVPKFVRDTVNFHNTPVVISPRDSPQTWTQFCGMAHQYLTCALGAGSLLTTAEHEHRQWFAMCSKTM